MAGVTLAGIPTLDAAIAHVSERQPQSSDLRALGRLLVLREDDPFALQTLGEIASADEQHAIRLRAASRISPGPPVLTLREALREAGYRRIYCVSVACFLAAAVDAPMRAAAQASWWRRSVRRAIIAQQVATGAGEHIDSAFAAALVGDLGDLLLRVYFPDLYAEAERFGPGPAHERAAWGYGRHDIAAGLARHWGFPPEIVDAIALKPCSQCDRRPAVELVDVVERARRLDHRFLEHCGSPLTPREIFADEPALAGRLERESGMRWLAVATDHILQVSLLEQPANDLRVA